ncbi:MAG: CoA pyrophosphatase [Candidatus Sedimenticola endophacoides]
MKHERLSSDGVARCLASAPGFPHADPYPDGFFTTAPTAAAVLVPLFVDRDEWRLLYIRRAAHDRDRHGGEVAFPGGKLEPGDRDEAGAALRESREEIGLEARHVTVLGELERYRTISNFLVRPVVARIDWPVPLCPDHSEVSRVFSIPLAWLAGRDNFRIVRRPLETFDGVTIPVYLYEPYENELLWGVTAKITQGLLQAPGLQGR